MFWVLMVAGIVGVALCFLWYRETKRQIAVVVGAVCILLFFLSWLTPQGEAYWLQLVASGKSGNWIVVDNSGGKTLRHWILEDSYVGSAHQSDGWKFTASDGISYVSGDAYVGRINRPLEEFLKDYKERYNIPEDQEPLR